MNVEMLEGLESASGKGTEHEYWGKRKGFGKVEISMIHRSISFMKGRCRSEWWVISIISRPGSSHRSLAVCAWNFSGEPEKKWSVDRKRIFLADIDDVVSAMVDFLWLVPSLLGKVLVGFWEKLFPGVRSISGENGRQASVRGTQVNSRGREVSRVDTTSETHSL